MAAYVFAHRSDVPPRGQVIGIHCNKPLTVVDRIVIEKCLFGEKIMRFQRIVGISISLGTGCLLSGCLAAAGAIGSAAVVSSTGGAAKEQAHDQNRALMRSDIEAAYMIALERHPEVFSRMSADDDEFYCLFRREYPSYVGLIKSRGEQRAAEMAVDNAASRSRTGECDKKDRMITKYNPLDVS